MITAVPEIVSLLKNPSVEGVNCLFCEVSIHNALKVATPAEWRMASDRQDQAWIDARNAEYEARRVALLKHISGDQISRETSQKISKWVAVNPYIRPVNTILVMRLESDLYEAICRVGDAYADRDRLHRQERFGWDSKANTEDQEYSAMLSEMGAAETHRDEIYKNLQLARSGFIAYV